MHYSWHLDEHFTVVFMTVSHPPQMLLSFKLWHILQLSPFGCEKIAIFTYDLQFILINIKNIKGVHYSWHLDNQFSDCFITVSRSAQMLMSFKLWHILQLSPFGCEKIAIFTYDLQFILINIKNIKGVHYSWHLDNQFSVCFITVSRSAQMLMSFKLWHILQLSPFGCDFFLHTIYSLF